MTVVKSFADLARPDVREDGDAAVETPIVELEEEMTERKWHFDPNLPAEGIAFGVSFCSSDDEERERFSGDSPKYFVYKDWVYLGEFSENGKGMLFVLPDSVSPDVRVNLSLRVDETSAERFACSLKRRSEHKSFTMHVASDGNAYINLRVFPDAEVNDREFEQVLITLYDGGRHMLRVHSLRVHRQGRKIWLRVVDR